jgi:pyruvate dehydrogenase (quinone)
MRLDNILEFWERQQMVIAGNTLTMTPGLPYAKAAQQACPWRQAVAVVDDCGFTMVMGEMATAVMHKLSIKVILLKNNWLEMVRFEQHGMSDSPYGISLQTIDFAGHAEVYKAECYRWTSPDDVELTLWKALASKKPTLVEFTVDPGEPPLDADQFKELL